MPLHDDERALMEGFLGSTDGSDELARRLGIPPRRLQYILGKWFDRGWGPEDLRAALDEDTKRFKLSPTGVPRRSDSGTTGG